MPSHRLSRGVLGALLSLVVATACGYDPNPASGKLHCGPDNSCPENYTCESGRCWRNGAGGSTGTGGTTGTGGSSGTAKFIGRWDFVSPAARTTGCAGVNTTVPLPVDANDFMTITAGSGSPLTGFYYCNWNLDLNGAATATVLRAGTTCTQTDTSQTPAVTFTWTGESFTLTTNDGSSGTFAASIPYTYTSSAGSGSCTMTFSGPVMKN